MCIYLYYFRTFRVATTMHEKTFRRDTIKK